MTEVDAARHNMERAINILTPLFVKAQEALTGWFGQNGRPLRKLDELQAENEQLRAALAQYANQNNWFQTTHMQNGDFPVRVWAWEDSRKPWAIAQKMLDQSCQT